MAKQVKLTAHIDAKVALHVGGQQVALGDLADALTRAGVELQALVAPAANEPVGEVSSVLDDLRPGEGFIRDRNGRIRSIEVREICSYNELTKVEGIITDRG